MIIYQKFISREDVRNNRDKIYLFGDNLERYGFGGQAKEMRGEPNAIGIVTKKRPTFEDGAYFIDDELELNKLLIDIDFDRIPKDKTIVVPASGIGTGLAQLDKRAPKTFEYLQKKLKELEKR